MKSTIKSIRFSKDILEEIQPVIEKKELNFTQFLMQAIREYIRMINYTEAVFKGFGAWKKEGHPELKHGSMEYVRKIRKDRKI